MPPTAPSTLAAADASPAAAPAGRLPLATLLVYAAPGAADGFMFMVVGTYLLKYGTDVLGISPGAMGLVLGLSRVWDAVSDPLVGYASDRTRTRLGRRRPWMVASALPAGATFILLWAPPQTLSGVGLVAWMAVSVVCFYTSYTLYVMPHSALGAELSPSYVERNRLFGAKRLVAGAGLLLAFGFIAAVSASDAPRTAATTGAVVAAVVAIALLLLPALRLRERPEFQGRGAAHPYGALRDVLRNPHARLLLLVFLLQQIGVTAAVSVAAYFTQYILGDPTALPKVLGAFVVSSVLFVPVWIALGERFEKKPLVVAGMAMVAVALGGLGFLSEGDLLTMAGLCALGGAAGAGLDVLLPSMQADIIDWDELRTGERKEGVYFAVWHFSAKTAAGIAGILVGAALQASGFLPNQPQGETTQLALRALMSGIPLACYGAGALVFLRFALTRAAHDEIRRALDRRA
ncbi:MAG TPA: MFS transporter [Myxococcota bacterium]|nr:MFS transporter [Myxococcota bacterium]